MFWIILSVVVVASEAAKLDNTYLPPPGAKQAGGNEDNLELPLEPPYIDQYSDNEPKYNLYGGQGGRRPSSRDSTYQPNQYGRGVDFDRVNNVQRPRGRDRDFIENEDEIRNVQKNNFDKPKSRFLQGSYSYTGPDNVLVTVTYTADNERDGRKAPHEDDERKQNDGVVPTPPSLPKELQRAFDFHKKKSQSQDEKKGYQYGKPSGQRDDKPDIQQGYSYPKQPQ